MPSEHKDKKIDDLSSPIRITDLGADTNATAILEGVTRPVGAHLRYEFAPIENDKTHRQIYGLLKRI